MNKAMYILIAIALVAGVVSALLAERAEAPASDANDTVACTQEARQCPDGSAVGRSGPQCAFAACPPSTVALNEPVTFGDTTLTPLRVIEDSRCPNDAQCVWAGTLTLEVRVERPDHEEVSIMSTGSEVRTAWGPVVLEDVTPVPSSDAAIVPAAYRFVFTQVE